MSEPQETVSVDYTSTIPVYKQVEQYLSSKIGTEWKAGDRLPSTREICEVFGGINHQTVRQAMRSLIQDGLVESHQGRGFFVMDNSNKMQSIALVVPNLDNEYTIKLAKGGRQAIDSNSFKPIILDSHQDVREELSNIRHLRDLPIEGAIIYPLPQAEIIEELVQFKRDNFPFVLVDQVFAGMAMPSVTVDSYRGGFQMTEFLIEKGYQKIAFVGQLGFSTIQQRVQGYRDAMSDHGLVIDRSHIYGLPDNSDIGTTVDALAGTVASILEAKNRPDAIFFSNDRLAIWGLEQFKKRGVEVPAEIAVVGFDNISEADLTTPGLTTMNQPILEIGRRAGKMLLELLENPTAEPEQVTLPVELVVRDSA